eukprot:6175838-Pyramimonas_sp.AAC.1
MQGYPWHGCPSLLCGLTVRERACVDTSLAYSGPRVRPQADTSTLTSDPTTTSPSEERTLT